jgi:carbamoyltransferase
MIILGIHSGASTRAARIHDSNITLIKDNKVIFSSGEARFSRKKYDGSFPLLSINQSLKKLNIQASDINIITWTSVGEKSAFWNDGRAKIFFKKLFKNAELIYTSHHTAHAAAALLSSNFLNEDVNVFTLDGAGDYYIGKDGVIDFTSSTFTIANQNNNTFNVISSSGGKESYKWGKPIGGFYLLVSGIIMLCITNKLTFPMSYENFIKIKSKFISENNNWDSIMNAAPGKIMGLAAYGDESKVKIPSPFYVFQTDKDSFPEIKDSYMVLDQIFGLNHTKNTFTSADLAAWLQKVFEDTIIEFLKKIPLQYKKSKLCFGGGCALNINLNSRIISEGIYEDVHIHPAPSDEGLSFGSAMYYAWRNNKKIEPLSNIGCVGNEYSDSEIVEALVKFSNKINFKKQEHFADVCNITAHELKDNKIIAWYQGKSEYGPRALGNRSILANPTFDNREILNTKIKKREFWRPYAAVILEEYIDDWFTCSKKPTYYMLFKGIVKDDKVKIIPSVVHKDNSCRVQAVNKLINKPLNMLIAEFMKYTKVPLLLNTSFNTLPGEPIVETPSNAITSFLNSEIDTLVINNYIIKRK